MDRDAVTVEDIHFPTSREARLVRCPAQCAPATVVAALQLQAGAPVVVVNGGTSALSPDHERALAEAMAGGVAATAAEDGATLVTGATDAGVFSLLGAALGSLEHPYVCVGVAPAGVTTWPGRRPENGMMSPRRPVPLEDHHTHFVIVEGEDWGSETSMMLALTGALSRGAPSVALLAGGGEIAMAELVGHLRVGRPVVVLAGSGRLADRVAGLVESGFPAVDHLAAVAHHVDLLEICDVAAGPGALRGSLRRRLGRRGDGS